MEEALLEANNSINYDDIENEQQHPKSIDIFQHLKLNMKCIENNCKDNNRAAFYCIPCKVSICHRCSLQAHKNHILIQKNLFELDESTINQVFSPLEKALVEDRLFTNSEDVMKEMISSVDNLFEKAEKKLEKLKKMKLQEIVLMFENFNTNVDSVRQRIEEAKGMLKDYMEKNKKFFNLKPLDEDNRVNKGKNTDEANTVFLMNYDMLNICHQKNKEIKKTIKILLEDLENFQEEQKEKIDKILKGMDDLFFDTYKDPEAESSIQVSACNAKGNANGNGNGKYIPNYDFIVNSDSLNNDHFKDISQRIIKYNKEIETFKKSIFDTVTKSGNLKDIEKLIGIYESVKQTGIDSLFSKRKFQGNKNKQVMEDAVITKNSYVTKDDVILNNRFIEKYYGYMTLDLYGKHFRMLTKELQSSHADLMIKVDPDEEEADYARPIEGTNEIVIYDRKKGILTKKAVNLTKNPFGYAVFPFGCRSLLVGDKFYVTGGTDGKQEYPNVVIYDRKTQHLKRIMDLRYARSYHTMMFNEVFETIMVFGGENNSTVEIFDPLTNRWQLLPSMNHPRANLIFYFDKPRGILYTLFGMEGKIINNSFSDIIEYFDLTEYKKGWVKMEYNNKSEADLKTHLGVFPLSSDKLLVYGGVTSRRLSRILCILNIMKHEIVMVDKKILEELRIEAKKSRKLSAIVSNVSIN